eukprot:3662769-Lingulodinium_polyedra.AAC.1
MSHHRVGTVDLLDPVAQGVRDVVLENGEGLVDGRDLCARAGHLDRGGKGAEGVTVPCSQGGSSRALGPRPGRAGAAATAQVAGTTRQAMGRQGASEGSCRRPDRSHEDR